MEDRHLYSVVLRRCSSLMTKIHNTVVDSEEYHNDKLHRATKEAYAKDTLKEPNKPFVVDGFCGTRYPIRFIVEVAWQAHFVTWTCSSVRRTKQASIKSRFHCLQRIKGKGCKLERIRSALRNLRYVNVTMNRLSSNYGMVAKWRRCSQWWNYFCHWRALPMHCLQTLTWRVNTAIFGSQERPPFRPIRVNHRDDEHGMDDKASSTTKVAAMPRLSTLTKSRFDTTARHTTLWKKRVTADKHGKIDFADKSATENTCVSYPFIILRTSSALNSVPLQQVLSADASAYWPPVSFWPHEQTKQYFLSVTAVGRYRAWHHRAYSDILCLLRPGSRQASYRHAGGACKDGEELRAKALPRKYGWTEPKAHFCPWHLR